MTRLFLACIVALALALAGSGLYIRHLQGQAKGLLQENHTLTQALDEAEKARKRDVAVLTRRAKNMAAVARSEALAADSLRAALARQQTWADAPVPQEVQDALTP